MEIAVRVFELLCNLGELGPAHLAVLQVEQLELVLVLCKRIDQCIDNLGSAKRDALQLELSQEGHLGDDVLKEVK